VSRPAIRALGTHTRYRCRHSGACCSSGWSIPVEVPVHQTIAAALAAGSLAATVTRSLVARADLPGDYASVLATRADGACVFFNATERRCTIHSALGPHAKPASCRAFPRVIVDDPRGTSVSLSHYCPSAADLLFDDDAPIALVETNDALGEAGAIEGLDARTALPPLLRDGVLVDWDAFTTWERFEMAVLEDAPSAEDALERLWAGYLFLCDWAPHMGALDARARALLDDPFTPGAERSRGSPRALTDGSLAAIVCSAIPSHLRPALPALDPRAGRRWDALVARVWPTFSRPLRRYLAARAVACWSLYQGQGLATLLVYLEAALAVVRWQAVERVSQSNAVLDGHGLREAIRQADLLLVHLAIPEDLAQALDLAADVYRRG
jgi:Fe-S-cluster containining protein